MRQEQAYGRIVGDLYQGVFDAHAWDRGLMGLARYIGGEGPLLMSMNLTTGAVARHALYSYSPAVFTAYAEHWVARDPRLALAMRRQELEVLPPLALFERRAWENTAIYNDYLQPIDAPYSLPCILRNSPAKFTFIAVQATNGRGPFDQADAARVHPLMRHVRRALEIKDRLEQQRSLQDSVRTVLGSLSFGVVILDEQRRIIEASPAASASLQTVCPSAPTPGTKLQLPASAQRELCLSLTSAFERGDLPDGVLHISRDPLRLPLSILVAPAPVTLQCWISSAPRWLLLVFDPERRLLPCAATLQSDWQLSPREAEVAALLAAGLRLPQIASRLRISLHTLRTQLKACFAKTGCNTQSDLLRAIRNSASWVMKADGR